MCNEASDSAGENHRKTNADPAFARAPRGYSDQKQPREDVLRPVAITADVAHDLFSGPVWMRNNPATDLGIEIKRKRDDNDHEQDDEYPFPDRCNFWH